MAEPLLHDASAPAANADGPLLRKLVIVGGGTAGWMAAAALSKVLRGRVQIELVESDDIGTVGVGEATIPMIQQFNKAVGLDENEFLRETQGTFKLGIEFVNWRERGHRYFHGFGWFGQALHSTRFEDYWQKHWQRGTAQDLDDYSIGHQAALAGRFMRPTTEFGPSPLADIAYAFHFDAHLYARFLRRVSEGRGVQRTEGRVVQVHQHHNGHVRSVQLASGAVVAGDFFLDCSGFQGLLIEQTLKSGFEDWSDLLPCDRAIAVPCAPAPQLLPFTRSTAHTAGWQWRIPLQHRIGNGHVFCSRFMSEDEATHLLLTNLDGEPLAEPRTLRFTTGMRKQPWVGNVLALGLAAGFMEPLESTSIHLVHTALLKLLQFFPDRGFNPVVIAEYNRQARFEWERIRDFLVLHYHQTLRDDSPFWRHCRQLSIPDTLRAKMDLYRAHGRVFREADELFTEVSWLQVMHGQGLRAEGYFPLVDVVDDHAVRHHLQNTRDIIQRCVPQMPTHEAYIARHCPAPAPTALASRMAPTAHPLEPTA
ncbi:tryptophan halogenase family protein [Roseateles sp. BYS87W]|uniref:Tryptophan halogenase family protein n=1 Tax=Pelomonas baiyunensis TaxID=3299026 RepID=A0ABW7H2G5_9BURK